MNLLSLFLAFLLYSCDYEELTIFALKNLDQTFISSLIVKRVTRKKLQKMNSFILKFQNPYQLLLVLFCWGNDVIN